MSLYLKFTGSMICIFHIFDGSNQGACSLKSGPLGEACTVRAFHASCRHSSAAAVYSASTSEIKIWAGALPCHWNPVP